LVWVTKMGAGQRKSRTVVQYSSVSLTTGTQVQSNVVLPTPGDVLGIDIDLTVNVAGTLTGAKTVENAISRFSVADRTGKSIVDVAGTDLPFLSLLLTDIGAYTTPETATASTNKYYRDLLAITATLANQPLQLQVTFAPYSALATSGATGATVSLTIGVWYGVATNTTRIYKRAVNVTAGDNFEGVNLVNSSMDSKTNLFTKTNILAFSIGTESNLNYVTFSSDGSADDLGKLIPQQLINLEDNRYRDGHQTGKFNLFVSPFVVQTQNTRLDFNAAGSDTITIYQIEQN